jgi:hypothetical protein
MSARGKDWEEDDIEVDSFEIVNSGSDGLAEIEFRPLANIASLVRGTFGGVGACSPELYRSALEQIAKMCGRECDDAFRQEVASIIKTMPCSLD